MIKQCLWVAACTSIFCLSSEAHAFNLGYHRDITVEALQRSGFSEAAIEVVLLGNTYNDLLQPKEAYFIIDPDIRDTHQKVSHHLHFDQLYRPELIEKYYRILLQNTRATLVEHHALPSLLSSQEHALITLGLTLHTIQDFYAHSSWANLELSNFDAAPDDATYFDIVGGGPSGLLDQAMEDYADLGLPKTSHGLFTHWTSEVVPLSGTLRGTRVQSPVPKHYDLAKEWASKAFFDDAYRQAYKASLEWVSFFRHVIVEAAPSGCSFGSPSIQDEAYWNDLIAFTEGPQDDDELDEASTVVAHHGTAHFMSLYGGAWKWPERWTLLEIGLHDLPNANGLGLLEQLGEIGFDAPPLIQEWLNSALRVGDGLFKSQAIPLDGSGNDGDLNLVEISKISLTTTNENHVVGEPDEEQPIRPDQVELFGNLPMTGTCVTRDLEWIASDSLESYTPNWVKVAAPFVRDNDNGDGEININDEDPFATSDYYGLFGATLFPPAQNTYIEAVNRDQSQAFTNWQVLLPTWNQPVTPMIVQLWESDQTDFFDNMLAALPFIDANDDLMDISQDDGDGNNGIAFRVLRVPFNVTNVSNGVSVEARPYGRLIRTSGNDDDFFGDFTASMDLQASPMAPPTKVELTVSEVTGTYVPRNSRCDLVGDLDGCEDDVEDFLEDEKGLTIFSTIDQHIRRSLGDLQFLTTNDSDLRAADNFSVVSSHLVDHPEQGQGGIWEIAVNPAFYVTYEGYVDSNTIPISFEITSTSLTPFRFPIQGGKVELLYNLETETWTGHIGNDFIQGVNGEDFEYDDELLGQGLRFRVTVDSGTFGALPPPQQVVEYFNGDPGNPNDPHIRPRLRIRNKGSEAVPLNEYKIRYWYTAEGRQNQNAVFDYVAPPLSQTSLTTRFAAQRRMTDSDGFVELGFTPAAGNLAPGAVTSEIQLRIQKDDWAPYREQGDYSYDPTKTSYAEWSRVTLYRKGVLIFGSEPTPLARSEIVHSVDVFIKDEGFGENNIVKPRFYLVNTGNVTLSEVHVRYHFTVENNKMPVLERYWLPDVTTELHQISGNHWVVDYHWEGMNFGPGTFIPSQDGFSSGIHYSDWSAFDKTNDASNPGTGTFVKTTSLEVTLD
jgi:hypothetical protein